MMELMHSTIGVALFLIGVALSFVIPFSPSIVAFYRKHNKRGTILVWNIIISIVLATPIGLAATTPTGTAFFLMLLLFIAWLIILSWACNKNVEKPRDPRWVDLKRRELTQGAFPAWLSRASKAPACPLAPAQPLRHRN
jgi:steroid 5-alpha reductase family enzyme